MNLPACRPRARHVLLAAALSSLLLISPAALAGPGAHGPDGEHLDTPAAAVATSTLPRLETATEAFELVALLRTSELVIVVDRYETNEPVLGAQLEVESGTLKAQAAFRPEQGDYTVTDAALLKALAQPGEHALVFTLLAGQDSDLLDGTLVTGGAGAAAQADRGHGHDEHDHDHGPDLERAAWTGAGLVALVLVGSLAWWRQRARVGSARKAGL